MGPQGCEGGGRREEPAAVGAGGRRTGASSVHIPGSPPSITTHVHCHDRVGVGRDCDLHGQKHDLQPRFLKETVDRATYGGAHCWRQLLSMLSMLWHVLWAAARLRRPAVSSEAGASQTAPSRAL